jgi:chromosome segregation ATPase
MSPFMHQVETEIRDLEEQHAEKDREIQLLKKELEATRAKLDEKENQLSDAASSISRVRENLNALHKKKVADLKTQLNEAREECEKQKRRNADSEQEMDEVLSERENLQRELSAIKALFNDFTVLAKV